MLKLTAKNESIWKSLIALAIKFQKESPWNYFEEYQIFAIESPETKEINYCQLMGQLGENISLCIYKGNIGLNSYFLMVEKIEQNEELDVTEEDPFQILQMQHCFQTTIEEKKDVDKEYRDLLNRLGFKLTSHVPTFIDFTPGLAPWIISDEQAIFMCHALEQTLLLCERIKDDDELIGCAERDSKYLLRKTKMEGDKMIWFDAEVIPDFSFNSGNDVIRMVNTANFQKLVGKLPRNNKKVLFFDLFDIPVPYAPDNSKTRPYFPKSVTCMDMSSDFESAILLNKIIPSVGYEKRIEDIIISLFRKNGWLPERIEVARESTFNLLNPFLDSVNVKLEISENQELLENILNPSSIFDDMDDEIWK